MGKSLVLVCNCGDYDGRLVIGNSRDVIAIACCLYSILGIVIQCASHQDATMHSQLAIRGQSKQTLP